MSLWSSTTVKIIKLNIIVVSSKWQSSKISCFPQQPLRISVRNFTREFARSTSTGTLTRNSAVADKPRDTFVQFVQWLKGHGGNCRGGSRGTSPLTESEFPPTDKERM